MGYLNKHISLRWLFSGLLLGIGFVLPALWILGVFGAAYFLHLVQEEQSNKSLYFGAWLAWSVKAAFASAYFWSTYPIEWLPTDFGNIQLMLIFMYWATVSICLGSGAIVVLSLYKLFQNYLSITKKYFLLLIFPFIWIAGEVIGSIMFSLMLIGPGGSIDASYSFGYAGYLLAEHDIFLQFARIGGVYSLSFLFVIGAVLFYLAYSIQKKVYQFTALVLIILIHLTSLMTFYEAKDISTLEEGYKVVTIDTNFPKVLTRDKASSMLISNSLNDAMEVALAQNADYILLPEDARYFDQRRSVSATKSLFKLRFDNPDVVIVDSGRAESESKTVLQAFVYNGPNNPVEQFHKRYLVPQGEYMPSFYSKFLGLIGFGKTANYLSDVISYEVGSKTSQAKTAENIPGVLFCFESVSPYGVRVLMKEKPDMPFVAHQVSHAWFHNPNALWHQLDAMLKVQAVWNQKYIISAGNYVEGKVIAPDGNIMSLETVATDEMWKVKKITIPK